MEGNRTLLSEKAAKSGPSISQHVNGASNAHVHGSGCSSHGCHSHAAPKHLPHKSQTNAEHNDLEDKRCSSSSSAITSHSNEESQDSQSCECCYCDKNNSKSPATRKLAAKKRLQALLQEKYRDQHQQDISDRLGSMSLKENKNLPSRTVSNDDSASTCSSDIRAKNIDELLGFIEGRPLPNPKKAAKKARQRQKKLEEQLAEEERLRKLEQEEKRKKKELKKLQRKQQAQAKAGKLPTPQPSSKAPVTPHPASAQPPKPSSAPGVPNGMVRITHNPLTNSAIITPLYGPIDSPSAPPSYFNPTMFNGMVGVTSPNAAPHLPIPQFPKHTATAFNRSPFPPGLSDQPRSYQVVNNSVHTTPSQPHAGEVPKMLNKNGFVEITGNKAKDQPMVTIRRVNDSRNDPVVTITLKGEKPEADRVLFTLVNGQAMGGTKNVPKPEDAKPSKAELKKELKKQKKKEKKKLYREQQERLYPQPEKKVTPFPAVVKTKPEKPLLTPVNETDVILENFKLPPGITVTRVQAPLTTSSPGIPFHVQTTTVPATTQQNTSQQLGAGRYFPAMSPVTAASNFAPIDGYRYPFQAPVNTPHMAPSVIMAPPTLNTPPVNDMSNLHMNSVGSMSAPNVIVVDTRQLSTTEKKCTSVGVQASETELLSKKQKKKLKKKEKKLFYAQQAEEMNKNRPKNVITRPETSNNSAAANPRIIPTANGSPAQNDTSQKEKKKGKKKGKKENWENIFVPKSDLDLDGSELDDVERELEAFKRFCFNSVPPERKEKVKVNLNVKDIFVKKRTED